MIYLDYAATTPPAPEVESEMRDAMHEAWGNPSSMHQAGQRARRIIDEARDRLGRVLGCGASEVIFTGGGTESDNLAIRGVVDRYADERGRHIVTTAVEHEAVLATCRVLQDRGVIDLSVVDCEPDGRTDPERIGSEVRPDTVLVSAMLVNNEVGAINDMAAIAEAVRRRNPATLIHTDAIQALGRVAVHPDELGVDLLSLSAHKVYGPKGAGALWKKRGVALTAQNSGGGQERDVRSGTENVAGIAGFGVAAERAEERRSHEMERQRTLAQHLRRRIAAEVNDAWIAPHEHAVANIVMIALADLVSEAVVTGLDREGICISGGSACSSGATQPSHVLASMRVAERHQRGPLRFSLGERTTPDDIDAAVDGLIRAVQRGANSSQAATAK